MVKWWAFTVSLKAEERTLEARSTGPAWATLNRHLYPLKVKIFRKKSNQKINKLT